MDVNDDKGVNTHTHSHTHSIDKMDYGVLCYAAQWTAKMISIKSAVGEMVYPLIWAIEHIRIGRNFILKIYCASIGNYIPIHRWHTAFNIVIDVVNECVYVQTDMCQLHSQSDGRNMLHLRGTSILFIFSDHRERDVDWTNTSCQANSSSMAVFFFFSAIDIIAWCPIFFWKKKQVFNGLY